ncbi:TolC family protein [Psittacicella hinzii]|uniref:Outer membrane protein n=1 Tax=Psittacicella hinzii TaxID=2028575 RepID=A0A3A1YJR0_9GAMM|nr:TolC family protein [Psittacicella hinzii]RIY36474.1 hypothetical protein CKF58_05790 [Psittacicella hinzii]
MKKFRLATIASLLTCIAASSAQAITLEESYQLALKNDLTFASAASTLQGTIAQANTNYAGVLPSVGFTYSWTMSRNLEASRDLQSYLSTVRLALSQNIFDWASFLKLDVAAKTKKQAEITYTTAQQDLINRVITRYLAVLSANANVQIAENQVKYNTQVYNTANVRYQAGVVSSADVDTASANLSNANATLLSAQTALNTAIANLKLVVGKEADLSTLYAIDNKVTPKLTYPTDVNSIQNNLSLKSLAMTKELARLNHSVAIAAYLPTLSLTAALANNSANNVNIAEHGWGAAHRLDRVQVGITLTVPIFTGGSTYNSSKYYKSLYETSSYSYDQTFISTESNFTNNLLSIKADEKIINSYSNSYTSALKAYNAKTAGYKVGTSSLTDLISAVNTLYQTESNLTNAKYDYITAVISQKVLAGNLTEDDIKEVSKLLTVSQKISLPSND